MNAATAMTSSSVRQAELAWNCHAEQFTTSTKKMPAAPDAVYGLAVGSTAVGKADCRVPQ